MQKADRQRTYPLRMSQSLRAEIETIAKEEHISLNHFISLALAEKLSRLEHQAWLQREPQPVELEGRMVANSARRAFR